MKKYYLIIVVYMLCANASIVAQIKSPYINKVFDFNPAPGQFVNEMPEYEPGDTKDDIIRKVEECIVGDEKVLVSLGSYGGSVVFGFDHLIVNVPDAYDFKVWGNAFYSESNPNPDAPKEGGSCEPGIVMVSYDANANGIPDDEWYELAGSEYYKDETIKGYGIVYYKPDAGKIPDPDNDYPFINDKTYIKWESNQGTAGYVYRNTFHSQSYYPLWLNDNTLEFSGTKLADNYIDESGNGSYFVQYAYAWGYADNHTNNDDRSSFKIEWAVDNAGNRVYLPGINFVKVYTGVNQYCGWLGETSTEIMGAEDLHLEASVDDAINSKTQQDIILLRNPVSNELSISNSGNEQEVEIYNVCGQHVISTVANEGISTIDVSSLSAGYYILKAVNCKIKFIK